MVEIEYVLALLPPKPQASANENDWISSIDEIVGWDMVIAGSYDHTGNVQAWLKSVFVCVNM